MTIRPHTTETHVVLRIILSAGALAVLLVLACVGAAATASMSDEAIDDVTFRGVVTGAPDFGGAVGAGGVNVQIEEIFSDSTGNLTVGDLVTVGYPIVPPFEDIDTTVGARVEVCGEYRNINEIPYWWSDVGDCWVWLYEADHFYSLLPPSTTSISYTGAPIDAYSVDEDVYVTGSGYITGTNADICVVRDQDWNDGDPIPTDVTGSVEIVSVVNGDIDPVIVWNAPLVIGEYDIVIDANQDGVYDASTDGLDSGSPGFVVIDMQCCPSVPVGPDTTESVPTISPIGTAILIGLFGILAVGRIRRRFK